MIKIYSPAFNTYSELEIAKGTTFATGWRSMPNMDENLQIFAMFFDTETKKIERVELNGVYDATDLVKRGRLYDHQEAAVDMTDEAWGALSTHLEWKYFEEEKVKLRANKTSPLEASVAANEAKTKFKRGDIVQLKPGAKPKIPGVIEGKVVAFFPKPAGSSPAEMKIGVAFSDEMMADLNGKMTKHKDLKWYGENEIVKMNTTQVADIATRTTIDIETNPAPEPAALEVGELNVAMNIANNRAKDMIATLKKGAERCVHFKKFEQSDSYDDEYETDDELI